MILQTLHLTLLLNKLFQVTSKVLLSLILCRRFLGIMLMAVGIEDFIDIMLQWMLIISHQLPMPLALMNQHLNSSIPLLEHLLRHTQIHTPQSQRERILQQFVALEELT